MRPNTGFPARIICFFLLLVFVPRTVSGFPGLPEPRAGAFPLRLPLDIPLFAAGAGLTVSALFFSDSGAEWDGVQYDPGSLPAFDRPFAHAYSFGLDAAGDVLLGISMAAPLSLLAFAPEEWLPVSVMYAETLLLANGIKETLKNAVRRPRPFMYADNPPRRDVESGDFLRSFPSGHTTMAFASAAFFSYTFAEYFPESPWRWPVVAVIFAFAAATAGLRMASANHFPTDVLAGALIGSAAGFLVPFSHTVMRKNCGENKTGSVSVSFSPCGTSVRLCW